jgi:hypothetical protein
VHHLHPPHILQPFYHLGGTGSTPNLGLKTQLHVCAWAYACPALYTQPLLAAHNIFKVTPAGMIGWKAVQKLIAELCLKQVEALDQL